MSTERILIFRGGAMGDFLLSLPALSALRSAFPESSVEVVGHPERTILAVDLVTRTHNIDAALWAPLYALGSDLTTLESLFSDVDLAIAYVPDSDHTVARNLASIGVDRVLVHPPRPDENGAKHAVDHLLFPVESLRIQPATRSPSFKPEGRHLEGATDRLAGLGIQRPFIALHAGSGGRPKQWDPARFANVIDAAGRDVLITTGPADSDMAERITLATSGPVFILDAVDLPTLGAIYSLADAFLGCDTGPTHLAAAVGTPTVALFGPTRPDVWGPRGRAVTILHAPEGRMDQLDPEPVISALNAILHA